MPIDVAVLPELSEADLEKLGVLLGHRKIMLRAIAALRGGAAENIAEPVPAPAPIPGEAERRQLTVMFCDLVGSTPLSTRFDPEDLREIVGAYHRCVADTVSGFAGFVAKYMGDGVLVYFGYPEAHEDDAERAVRAGLAVIDAVRGLATPEALNVRRFNPVPAHHLPRHPFGEFRDADTLERHVRTRRLCRNFAGSQRHHHAQRVPLGPAVGPPASPPVWWTVFDWIEKYADHEPDWADGYIAALCGRDRTLRVWTYDKEFRTTWRRPDGSAIPLAVRA